ncbi:MAG: hypothetical protein MN733_20720 [Nitrososphaera sp.]|nr:hypothetical protein [Nitrososphaera sp.]
MDMTSTTDTTITVPAEYIHALKLFCAQKHNMLYYLIGIYLEIFGTEARLVATDGHRLGIFRIQNTGLSLTKRMTAIIPSDLLKDIKPKGTVAITLKQDQTITVEYAGKITMGKAINARYPNYRGVIPHNTSGNVAQFNADYLADFARASCILDGKKASRQPVILHNGESAALVYVGNENFIGLIMSRRSTATKIAHDWVYEKE